MLNDSLKYVDGKSIRVGDLIFFWNCNECVMVINVVKDAFGETIIVNVLRNGRISEHYVKAYMIAVVANI